MNMKMVWEEGECVHQDGDKRERGERVTKMYHVRMKLSKNKAYLKNHLCSTQPLRYINLYSYTGVGKVCIYKGVETRSRHLNPGCHFLGTVHHVFSFDRKGQGLSLASSSQVDYTGRALSPRDPSASQHWRECMVPHLAFCGVPGLELWSLRLQNKQLLSVSWK